MPAIGIHLSARGDIRPCRFVKLDTATEYGCLECDANELPVGISQEGTDYPPLAHLDLTPLAARSGYSLRIFSNEEECLVEAGGDFNPGDLLKADDDGKAVAALLTGTTVQNVGAIALEAATAGQKVRVRVRCEKFLPAVA